jgi:hypothetical protein
MLTDEYEKLHEKYLQTFVAYHNAYLKYIKGRQARIYRAPLRAAIIALREINTQMLKELTVLRKAKFEADKDKYHWQRQQGKNKNVNNTD